MAKCEVCGKGGMGIIHGAYQFTDKRYCCKKCFKSLGYTDGIFANIKLSMHYSWDEVKDGKEAFDNRSSVKVVPQKKYDEYSFYVDEVNQRLVTRYLKEETDPDDYYEGVSNKEFKEDYSDGDRLYKYPLTNIYPELKETTFEGEQTYGIYLDDALIGYAPETKYKKITSLIQNKSIDVSGEIYGGEYKQLFIDEVEKDSTDIKIRIDLAWPVETGENE